MILAEKEAVGLHDKRDDSILSEKTLLAKGQHSESSWGAAEIFGLASLLILATVVVMPSC